jgi:hypothetical protein
VTDHTHEREAEAHYVDTDTCVHRLLSLSGVDVTEVGQCTHAPTMLVAGWPTCDLHTVRLITWEHERGNPDPVVRRLL